MERNRGCKSKTTKLFGELEKSLQKKRKKQKKGRHHTTATTSNCTMSREELGRTTPDLFPFLRQDQQIRNRAVQHKTNYGPSHIITVVITEPLDPNKRPQCEFSFPVHGHYLHYYFLFSFCSEVRRNLPCLALAAFQI